ncbi:MAG: hypothetical protein WKF79_04720 [Nocardioides sp.]
MKRLLVAGFVILVAVSGCSDDPKPKFAEPADDPSPTSTQSQEPTPTASPGFEPRGPAGVIEAFYAAVDKGLRTGDPSGFLLLAADECSNCQTLARNLRGAYANDGYIRDGRYELLSADYVRDTPIGEVWNVRVSTSRERWFNGDDELVKIVNAGILGVAISLEGDGSEWRVRELQLR